MVTDTSNLRSECPVCGEGQRLELLAGQTIPAVCNVLYDTKEQAVAAPIARMDLAFCDSCGHLFNDSFKAEDVEYGASYENSLHFSNQFQRYAEGLADRLVSKHGIYGKKVVEIGCGKGEFLSLLCSRGNNQGIGFDPSYQPGRDGVDSSAVEVVQEYYSEKYAHLSADLVVCRHVLEHIADPVEFLTAVHRTVADRPDALIYFEVPDGLYMLREMAVWDLIYEHFSYFTPTSLTWVFQRAGFEVIEQRSGFGGQFLQLLARPQINAEGNAVVPETDADLKRLATAFGKRLEGKVTGWQERLSTLREAGRSVAVWGAGAKGVSFANMAEPDAIDCLVDINPHKKGRYIPTTGHQIVSPETLAERRTETILLMNGNYADEVSESLNKLGLRAELLIEREWYC